MPHPKVNCVQPVPHLFLAEVPVHLPHAGVSMSVDGAAMDVMAKQLAGHDKHADVADGAEVDKLDQLVLNKPLVDQEHVHSLQEESNAV